MSRPTGRRNATPNTCPDRRFLWSARERTVITRYTVHGRGAKRVTLTGDKSVWILPSTGLEPFRWITVDLRTMTHGQQKLGFWAKTNLKKYQKSWSKTGSPNLHILFLKALLRPSFSGSRKINVSKHQCPTACVHPSYPLCKNSLNLVTNERTNVLTEFQINASTNNKALRAIIQTRGRSPSLKWIWSFWKNVSRKTMQEWF